MKNIKIFAFLAIFLLSAAVSTAWAKDVTLTYRIEVQGTLKPVAHIYNAATGEEVASWDHGIKTLWPAGEGHTMDDDCQISFTPNQELDKTGKNENGNKVSTAFSTEEKETDFQVKVGKEGFYLKSVTFKENNTVKASSSNIAPNSTSIGVRVPANKFFNYITVVLTVDAYTVSVPENLTISDAFVTINRVKYYKSGETVTFGFSGSGSVVYFVNGERIEGNSVTVGKKDLKVEIGIPYIDENGKEQIRKPGEYTVLTSLTDVSNLGGGWYVVQGKVEYTSQVMFSGDAHLILADSAEMEIVTEGRYEHGINANGNLNIYGQNGQSGILNDTAKGTNGSGIYCDNGVTINGGTVTATSTYNYGIYGDNGVTINGGTVEATGKIFDGIYSYKGVTINGGTVEATGYRYGIYGDNGVTINGGTVEATGERFDGIFGPKGVTISGGKVEATGKNSYGIYGYKEVTISGGKVEATGYRYGIYSEKGNIILGWTNSTDFIYASGYSLGDNKKHVSIAEGKSFKDDKDNVYSGTLTGEQLSAIKGKKLEPCYAVTFDAQNGDDPIMLLTSFDENGVAHVKKPADPIRSGFTFEGWFTATDGNTEFDFSAAITGNTTAYAKWKENALVEYIDENGGTNETKNYILLTNDINVDNLPGGWYVVQGEVSYEKTVTFSGDAHLILADGATMEIGTESKYGIYASNNLTIYGQNEQRGILNDTANGTNGIGIYSEKGNITINGGTVTATGTGLQGSGIFSVSRDITISGGTVTATGYNGIYSKGIVTISGGTVTATGDNNGIYSNGDITLGWTNSTDSIKASSYSGKNGVSIAEGKSFKDDKDNVYSGTLTGEQLSAIKGKKLEPCYAVTFDAQNGDDPIMLLTTFDENGVAHVAKPNDPIRSGFTFEGWFTATDGNTEFDFSAAITGNTTAYAHWNENTPVEYIDENGGTNETKNYILLTNDINVDNLPGGWYVVQGKVEYSNQVKFSGDAHLILADGAKLEIETKGESEHGIYASNNLTIYGQNGQSGILNDTAKGTDSYGIYSYNENITIIGGKVTATGKNGYGINSSNGSITISGGSVTATGGDNGIRSYKEVTISGGSVTATGVYGIYSSNGSITISGGSVTATGTIGFGIRSYKEVTISGGTVTATSTNGGGIYSNSGNITLGWTNSTDSIKASSYYGKNGVSIAEGKSFKDEDGKAYSDTLTGGQLSAIKSKKLEPCYAVTFDAQNGDDPIMLLTTFDENGVAHVEKPADPTRDGYTFAGWFTTADGGTEFDFSAAITGNTTAYAKWGVPYIDEKGKPQIRKPGEYTVLTSLTDVSNLRGGWYVVQGEVKYSNQVKFSGDAHLILADGAEMNVNAESDYASAIFAEKNLTIYGQSNQSGILNATAKGTNGSGIYSWNDITISGGTVTATGATGTYGDGICGYNGVTISGGTVTASGNRGINGLIVTINGGSVTATSTIGYGIYGMGDVTISGGTVTATGEYDGIYGNVEVTISGGSVTATGKNGDGIYNDKGNITLGWTNSTDFIYASSYSLGDNEKHVSIAKGKSLKDENGKEYSGMIGDVSDIAGKTLVPPSFEGKFLSDVNIAVADIPVQKYADGEPICPSVVVTDGNDTLRAGTDYTVTCFNNTAVTSATLDEAAIAQITGKGNYAGAIQKRFFIWNNIHDYAAVQVFGDADGNTHAEIDGAYDGTDAVAIDEDVENVAVKFNRNFTVDLEKGGFSTLMLPFSVSTEDVGGLGGVYMFAYVADCDGDKKNDVCISKVWEDSDTKHQTLEAYTPYMVRMKESTLKINKNVTLAKTSGGTVYDKRKQTDKERENSWQMRGVFGYKKWACNDDELGKVWGYTGEPRNGAKIGKYMKFGKGVWINPFRAYLFDPDGEQLKCTDESNTDGSKPQPIAASPYAKAYTADFLPASAKSAANATASSEMASLDEFGGMQVVLIDGESGNERPTVIGHMNPATGEVRMQPRTKQTYDLKGRRVGNGKKAKGAYYRRKTIDERR